MNSLDVVLFGVIVIVGYGFARMGFRLSSRSAVKEEKAPVGTCAKNKAAEDKQQDGWLSHLDRLLSGILFAGFGMVIIWMAIDRYLPLALNGDATRPSPTEVDPSEVMGEVLLKVMVLQPTGESEETDASTAPRVRVQVEESSLRGDSLDPSGAPWKWIDVAHPQPLPRPTLFADSPPKK